MAFTVTRHATVYRLWRDDELLDALRDHVATGWIANIVGGPGPGPGDPPTWGIRFQRGTDQHASESLNQVVVSDTAVIQILDPQDYAVAYPDNPLPQE